MYKTNIDPSNLEKLVITTIEALQDLYDELVLHKEFILKNILEEIQQVEELVNLVIKASFTVTSEEMTFEQAKENYTTGLFTKKNGSIVKVYSIGDFTKEVCGVPHVDNSSKIGLFRIVKEESAGAGIRRIKAILK